MSGYTIVTEGQHNVAFLQALLNVSNDDPAVKFVAAGGWSGADSLARSFLVHGETKIILVVDADTTDPNLVEDRKRFLKGSLGDIAPPTMWNVVVIAPEIEGLLFEDREVIESLVGSPITDTEFVSGSFEPKRVLHQLLREKNLAEVYTRTLRNLDLNRIRQAPPIRDLQAILERAKTRNGSHGEKRIPASTG